MPHPPKKVGHFLVLLNRSLLHVADRRIAFDLHDSKLGGRVRKKKLKVSLAWKLAGLGVLTALAFGAIALAVFRPGPPAVSETVANYSAPPITKAPLRKVVVIGDSYSQGAGATQDMGWVDRMGRNQPWSVTNLSRGGTGYVASVKTPVTAQKACGLEYCPSYPEMITEAATVQPEIVIVAGGRNDSRLNSDAEAAAIASFYAQLRAALPNATIVAFNAWWDSTEAPESIASISAAVKSSVEASGGAYLDSGQPLAGKRGLVGGDGVHPNNAGHAAIFEATIAKLQAAGIAIK